MRLFQVLVLVVVVVLSEGADVQPSCGRVAGNVGGQNIPPGRWPWFAGLYLRQNLDCSGSLISDQWVLTAARCFLWEDPSDITVVLGRTNQTGSNPNEVSRGINQTVCHPLSNPITPNHDICLVKLSSPVELSDHISPVCLDPENSTFPSGTFSWITAPLKGGAGELTELQLQILGNDECRSRSTEWYISAKMICTRDDPPEEEPCLETRGAPLLIRNDDLVWIQVGVSSFGKICRKHASPPIYTRVSRYQEWIRNVTAVPSSGDDGVSTSTHSPTRPSTTPPVVPPRTTCDSSIFSSSEKLSSTFFTSVLALLFSLVVLLV